MKVMDAIQQAARDGKFIHAKATIVPDLGGRMLAKLGLALGYRLFGPAFLSTDYAKELRRGFREADPIKRRRIPIRGSSFLNSANFGAAGNALAWKGGWVLLVRNTKTETSLSVVSPSGKLMTVVICPDASGLPRIDEAYDQGLVWVTIPLAAAAAGPIPLLSYLAHKTGQNTSSELAALDSLWTDPSSLPPC
jgi:hypothetical protein